MMKVEGVADLYGLVYGDSIRTDVRGQNSIIECFRELPSKEMRNANTELLHQDMKRVPGTFVRLTNGFKVPILDDSAFRCKSYKPFLERAEGNILIIGIGLGQLLHNLRNRPGVKTVTVVERDGALLKLVKPYFENMPFPVRWLNGDVMENDNILVGCDKFFDYIMVDTMPELENSVERDAVVSVYRSRLLPKIRSRKFVWSAQRIYVWGEEYYKILRRGEKMKPTL